MKEEVGDLTQQTLEDAIAFFGDIIENPDRILEIQSHQRLPIPLKFRHMQELSLVEYLKLKEQEDEK